MEVIGQNRFHCNFSSARSTSWWLSRHYQRFLANSLNERDNFRLIRRNGQSREMTAAVLCAISSEEPVVCPKFTGRSQKRLCQATVSQKNRGQFWSFLSSVKNWCNGKKNQILFVWCLSDGMRLCCVQVLPGSVSGVKHPRSLFFSISNTVKSCFADI